MNEMNLKMLNSTTAENQAWDNYLKNVNEYMTGKMPKGSEKNIRELNHIGSTIVKNRAVKTAMAGILINAQKAKKGIGLKTNQNTSAEKLISRF